MKRGLLFILMSLTVYGTEMDFSKGSDREMNLLDGGRIRINEVFKWDTPSKEVVLQNLPQEIKRETLMVENDRIKDTVFSVRRTDKEGLEREYRGRRVSYRGEEYTLLSLNPLIIEGVADGRVVINPDTELEVSPGEEREAARNSLKITGENLMNEVRLSYEFDSLKWQQSYNLNLDSRVMESVVVLKNQTNRALEDMELKYERNRRQKLNLDANVEKKLDISKVSVGVEKKYTYYSSQERKNPEVTLRVRGDGIPQKGSVNLIEDGRYIGSVEGSSGRDHVDFKGIVEKRIEISKENEELRFGEKLSRNSVDFSIKNYRSEGLVINLIYDELPEKWYEMRSDLPYEITKEGVIFRVAIPANSVKKLKFSYIMEKI